MTEARIIGHMVVRNERHRYLEAVVAQLQWIAEPVVVIDDWSDDGTYEFLQAQGMSVERRSRHCPSFSQEESAFRSTAWSRMEDLARPHPGDWILCLDADELLATRRGDPREVLRSAVAEADRADFQSLAFSVHEVFKEGADGAPWRRTDGFWGSIRACRLVRWHPDGVFQSRREGGGSVPTAWATGAVLLGDPVLLHYGYLRPQDRLDRYRRYRDGRGHNPAHVASILGPPQLEAEPEFHPWAPPR